MAAEEGAGTGASRATVCIYVPCYNLGDMLAAVLDGIAAQSVKPDQVLVIDDASTDDPARIVARYPFAELIRHEVNKGLAAGRNTAFSNTTCDLVAGLDGDVVAEPNWLAAMLEEFADPKVGLVGGHLQESVAKTYADRWRWVHMRQEWGEARIVDPPFIYGANTLARRAVWSAVHGYDEILRTNGEDVDFSDRVKQLGFVTIYTPKARARHLKADTIWSLQRAVWRYFYFGLKRWSLPKKGSRIIHDHIWQALVRRKAREDARAGRWDLVPLDLWIATYMLYRETRYRLSGED
ncbi:MAG: glycosyltransferase [Methylovirgula sp.]